MYQEFSFIIGLALVFALVRFIYKAKFILFIIKKIKWFIGFYLLFAWLVTFIGIDLEFALLGSIAVTLIAVISFKESKWHTFTISSFYTILTFVVIGPYVSFLFGVLFGRSYMSYYVLSSLF